MLNAKKHFLFTCGCSWTPRILLTSYSHLHSTFSSVFSILEIHDQGQAHTVSLGEPNTTKYQQDTGFNFASY